MPLATGRLYAIQGGYEGRSLTVFAASSGSTNHPDCNPLINGPLSIYEPASLEYLLRVGSAPWRAGRACSACAVRGPRLLPVPDIRPARRPYLRHHRFDRHLADIYGAACLPHHEHVFSLRPVLLSPQLLEHGALPLPVLSRTLRVPACPFAVVSGHRNSRPTSTYASHAFVRGEAFGSTVGLCIVMKELDSARGSRARHLFSFATLPLPASALFASDEDSGRQRSTASIRSCCAAAPFPPPPPPHPRQFPVQSSIRGALLLSPPGPTSRQPA